MNRDGSRQSLSNHSTEDEEGQARAFEATQTFSVGWRLDRELEIFVVEGQISTLRSKRRMIILMRIFEVMRPENNVSMTFLVL